MASPHQLNGEAVKTEGSTKTAIDSLKTRVDGVILGFAVFVLGQSALAM